MEEGGHMCYGKGIQLKHYMLVQVDFTAGSVVWPESETNMAEASSKEKQPLGAPGQEEEDRAERDLGIME